MSGISTPTLEPQPSGTVVHRRYWPVATLVLTALCIIVYILEDLAPGGSKSVEVLLEFGASYRPYLRAGEYWRLVMPMFLHIGWLHITLNMLSLIVIGPMLERVYGYGRFSVIYVGSGIASSFVTMMFSRDVAAGASGAICGVAAAMVITGWLHNEVVPLRWKPAFGNWMIVLILLTLASGLVLPRVLDNWGHAGGLAAGALLALVIPPPGREHVFAGGGKQRSQWMAIVPAAIIALAMGATASHYVTSKNVTRLLREGQALRQNGHDNRAAALFRNAEALDPHDERPHLALGSLDLSENRLDDAIREYQVALRLNPDLPEAQLGLAAAFGRLGDEAKATKWLEAAVGKNAVSAAAQAELGDLCLAQKLYPEAIQHYQLAVAKNPNLVEAQNNLAWLLATAANPKDRDPAQALAHAIKAVELSHWKQANIIDTLAEAYYVNGKYQQAVATQKKAVAIEPKDRKLKEHLAKYLKAAGS